jgi:phage shock protein PspC (stress-responsive transcriptional regulator)
MKKTIQINLGGRHFHIDEDGYSKLNHYLDSLKSHFSAEGESGKEIVEDIEQRIAELLENRITPIKQAVSLEDVLEIIGILGRVEDFIYDGQPDDSSKQAQTDRRDQRRFFRDSERGYFGGVCAGLGEYFNIDPIWIRLAFISFGFLKGLGILIYVILWIVVPKARSTADKLQMKGLPVTLSTIKESVNAEYDKVKSGFKDMGKSSAAEKTRNVFESIMKAIGFLFVAFFKFLIAFIGILFLVIGSVFLACLIAIVLGFSNVLGHFQIWNGVSLPDFSHLFASSGHYFIVAVSFIILVLIPIVTLMYGGIKILFSIKTKHPILRAFVFTAWILDLILFVSLLIINSTNYAVGATGTNSEFIKNEKYPRIVVDVRDNTENKKITRYRVFDLKFNYSERDESLFSKAKLSVVPSGDDKMVLTLERRVKNVGLKNSQRYLDRIKYNWEQDDSVLYLNEYFNTDGDDFWLFSDLDVKLSVPEGQEIVLSPKVCDMLEENQRQTFCTENPSPENNVIVAADGTLMPKKQVPVSIGRK